VKGVVVAAATDDALEEAKKGMDELYGPYGYDFGYVYLQHKD